MHRQSWFRAVSFSLLVLALLSSCQKTGPRARQGGEEKPAVRSGLSIEERLAARPAGLGGDSLTAAAFAEDPHTFACATCHGSTGRKKSATQWRATCESSGCHERAWPKTVFHRVRVSTFFNCLNCHRPHVFRLNGEDCLSCHGNVLGPAGNVQVVSLPGVATFPHARHRELDCATCHSVEKKHAELTMTSSATCNSCHHGPPPAADCTTCHARTEIAGRAVRPVTLEIAGQKESRRLPFDHQWHQSLPCSRCHASAVWPEPRADCAGCHQNHAGKLDRNCRTCHQPPPEGVHPMEVHETGCADCHGAAGLTKMETNRNFCLACHTGMTAHNPGKNCATCHKLASMTQGGGR